MPHLSPIGKKSPGSRLLVLMMYLLLTLGGVTMVAPFLIWVSTSFTSEVDSTDIALIPAYWHNRDVLMRKYLEQQANFDITLYGLLSRDPAATFKEVSLPQPANDAESADYCEFVKSLPDLYTALGSAGPTVKPLQYGMQPAVQDYRAYCLRQYRSIEGINAAYGTAETNITRVLSPRESWWMRRFQPSFDRRMAEFMTFKKSQPAERIFPVPAEGIWVKYLREKIANDVKTVNSTLQTHYQTLDGIPCPTRLPAGSAALRKQWEDCIRNDMALWFIRADNSARPEWTAFLQNRYKGDIDNYNSSHTHSYASFAAIPIPSECPRDTTGMSDWNDFIVYSAPIGKIYLDSPEERYRAFLREKYASLDAVNRAYGVSYADWQDVLPPTARLWAAHCAGHVGAIRWDFITRNYRTVFAYMALQGHSFLNTLIYVGLALLFTLIVNPMAAYALSRFRLSFTNKVLLFLLATMAFPAEISMIQNFLLLKEMHLLNTFWALVLPGMANGFSIFLLKGMFDSLPQDLYEAAELDGAGEAVIFAKVTMPLVKPFLAYLSLNTFVLAYSAFAFAFILCPDPKMWTLMVYLQQMEQWASQPVQFAGFVLASIPTLIVFIACQRVIMQGIVLPTEK